MKENEHFWLGVTLSDDPAPDDVFVVASYEIKEDGGIGSTASRVVDPAVREDLAGALRAIADGSEAPTAPHGWLTLEGFADKPAADVDFAFDTVGYGTVVNVEHADAGEDVQWRYALTASGCEAVGTAKTIMANAMSARPKRSASMPVLNATRKRKGAPSFRAGVAEVRQDA